MADDGAQMLLAISRCLLAAANATIRRRPELAGMSAGGSNQVALVDSHAAAPA
jgi:hypothetical protein